MADVITFVPRYDRRTKLVQDILQEGASLTDQESHTLAIRILSTLDTLPGRSPPRATHHRLRGHGVVRHPAGMHNTDARLRSPTSMEARRPSGPSPRGGR
ncbi:DUF6307 family protein [Amycolatopsis cihanbeyliensis]|uniref:Uncharacterized protein n=1 Tax=Amycolatopsis cihanbeyliensis TaxID=1128664 RepID=A0A542DKK5_AMYCI|nr:hypothetical protein FB471_3226 [Amycolatopsis cihanbeyliensis]